MKFNRRQFLFFGGSLTVGAGLLSWKFIRPKHPEQLASQTVKTVSAKASQDNLLLRFVSVADTGTGDQGQYAVANAMIAYHKEHNYDLVVLAGDNIYTNGEMTKIGEVFERPYRYLLDQGVKFHACLGNHDIRTDNGNGQVVYPDFNMKGRYYTFSRNDVQFFALDTNGNADWKNQLIWLDHELSQSKATWKIVFGHHPTYASGVYGSNPEFIKTFTPIFQKYGVHLYINGHEHHYERTRSINDTTYLICGAGAGHRPIGRHEWTEYITNNLSFAVHEVYADRIEISGVDTNKSIFDRGVVKLKSI